MNERSETMAKMIFVNLPVTDLERSIAFYRALGAEQNLQFSDATAAMMSFSAEVNVMLLTHDKYGQFTSKPIADAHAASQVLLCLSSESRETVDAAVAAAAGAGGVADPGPKQDHGFMYGRSFEDPDGHHWEIMWMDMSALRDANAGDSVASPDAPDAVQAATRAE
jgi:predicted lactoylglutathione lyase